MSSAAVRSMNKFKITPFGGISWYFLLFAASLQARTSDDHYTIAQYTDEHGLPQNSIKGIGADNLGFIWLITEKGVVRYDGGDQFKTFDELSQQVASNRMFTLHSSTGSDGLWAQTGAGEMICLKNGRTMLTKRPFRDVFGHFEVTIPGGLGAIYRLPHIYPGFSPADICLIGSNRFIIRNSFIVGDSLVHVPGDILAPFQNHDRRSFFGTHDRLYYIKQLPEYQSFSKDGVVSMGKIQGDLRYEKTHPPFELFWNTASNQLFVYTDNKCYHIRTDEHGQLTSDLLYSGFDFSENRITSAYYDAARQMLLLGSETKGLFVIRQRKFHVVSAREDSPRNPYYIQTLLENGLLVTNDGMAFHPDGTPQLLPLLSNLEKQENYIIGPLGNLWVLRADSILVFAPDAKRLLEKKPNPTTGKVILRDEAGAYWLGGDQGKVLSYDATADTFHFRVDIPYPISFMEQAGDKKLLIATHSGLFLLNTSDNTYEEIPEFRNRFIRSIYRDSDSRHWICTYQHGFYLYERGKVTAFPLDEHQYLATPHCILADKNGYFWISTNKGLFQVLKQQLLDYQQNARHPPYYFYYDKSHGFSTNEFNGGCQPCAVELPNGNFSFPSLDGLVWFNPLTLVSEFPSGKIILDEARLDGKALSLTDTLHIPPQFSRLDLKIAIPFYGNLSNLTAEYQLYNKKRPSNGWLPLHTDNAISINELNSGSHEVRVRIRRSTAYNDFRYETFHLYVRPSFYETWWFRTIAYCSIGLLIWALIQIRTKLVIKQNRLLAKKVAQRTAELDMHHQRQRLISASITHDIKSPLKYVVKALKGMEEANRVADVPPEQITQLYHSTKQIYSYADNLTKLAKVLLDDGNLTFSNVNIFKTVQQQIDVFRPLAKLQVTKIINDIPEGCIAYTHTGILAMIVHNLLDNAVKFTENGIIRLSTQQNTDGTLGLYISDTGTGLDGNEFSKGLGLRLVDDISRLIHIKIAVQSAHEHGTTVTLILPKNP